jgi:IMP dehydrogenase/GMP reductase
MTKEERKFDFDDILITPKTRTNINSRFNDIDPYVKDDENILAERLPLFTAPMSSVLNDKNYSEFNEVGIRIVMPRTSTNKIYNGGDPIFHSYSISEFEEYYVLDEERTHPDYVLIDVANGHMDKILRLATKAKLKSPELTIMAGNIANPSTYKMYVESGAIDYVRVGIGNGNGCLTTQQTGVGYPKASLINECYHAKLEMIEKGYTNPTKIVADGGMKDYSDIIKALALGADYVMVGSILNKALESSGQNYLYGFKISPMFAETCYNNGFPVKKQFYGMSTKLAQKKLGSTKLKTSEGVVRYRKVEYKIFDWVQNFEHYLRSAMSYSNARNLNEFIGKAHFNLITENAFNRFKK